MNPYYGKLRSSARKLRWLALVEFVVGFVVFCFSPYSLFAVLPLGVALALMSMAEWMER